MPPEAESAVKKWQTAVSEADKDHKRWWNRFQCDTLEEYYLGEQWGDLSSYDEGEEPYTINRVFPSIETRKPALLFTRPEFKLKPRPAKLDDPLNNVKTRLKLREDTLNTVTADKDMHFEDVTSLCIHESQFAFGMIEVGYSADFIDNPNFQKPVRNEDGTEVLDDDGTSLVDTNEKIPERERVFLKRIPAKQFRVCLNGQNLLHQNDWVGYFEWHYPEDIKANPNYNREVTVRAVGRLKKDASNPILDEESGDYEEGEAGEKKHRDMVKLWKIWDLRAKTKYVFTEESDGFLLETPFEFLPFAGLKFHPILDEWYGLPPVFNWLDPQDELNECREMQRAHRRRAQRRYGHLPGAEKSLQKLENGGDFAYAEFDNPDAVWPIPDAPLDPQIFANTNLAKEDFDDVSGVTAEQRGISQAETATQANIMDSRAQIREQGSRYVVAKWLAKIGWLILRTIEENMTLPFWIETNVDLQGPNAPMEALETALTWQQITSEQLGEASYEVGVEVASLSPVAQEQERASWNQVLALISSTGLQAILASSDLLLRKTLRLYGIQDENEILEIQGVLQNLVLMQAMAAGRESVKSSGAGDNTGPGPTPTNADTKRQIDRQLGAA